ncbi:MAG: aldehyde dehydrogenase family protein [Planctomycetota bacterium]|nr:MAG: aldehyde dehydrogenase family protein [Planctomycetota bacterium]
MSVVNGLSHSPSNLIGDRWESIEGSDIVSHNPAHPSKVVWSGREVPGDVDRAVSAARAALPAWSRAPVGTRVGVLRRFQEIAKARKDALDDLICEETGKAMWESTAEAGLISGKVDITLEEGPRSGRHRVDTFEFDLGGSKTARCHFKPHGVMAVVGPYNFPAHLPNGHIVPSLLMGNTVVFKPSDKAPGVGQMLIEMFDEALSGEGIPPGVVNLVHGRADVASRLVTHDGVDGILFTGSWPVGRKILEANLERPGRIVALEMGGNNPAVVMPDADLYQAVVEVVRCAFNTTGQRCTSTRRLIVHEAVADRVLPAVVKAASSLVIGDPRSGDPVFMGPIISQQARDAVFDAQRRFARQGGRVILESTPIPGLDGWYLTPSVIVVDRFAIGVDDCGCDEEVFGPMLRVCVVKSLDEAIEQANATRYGLAASIFTADPGAQERFLAEARAGCVNINCGTAGASSKLPFGGLGFSGNHRPAGAFSLDYCAYPVATMIEGSDAATLAQGMRVDRSWVG